jgi:hypothetical protein
MNRKARTNHHHPIPEAVDKDKEIIMKGDNKYI